MSLLKIVAAMQQEAIKARTEEKEILQSIANITTAEFAEEAAETLDPTKHTYAFEAYLILLSNLRELLIAGVPPEYALDSVQTGWSVDRLLSIWRLGNE